MALREEALERMVDPSKINCLRLTGNGQYMSWIVEFVGGKSVELTQPTVPMFVRSPRSAIKKALGENFLDDFHFDKSGLFAVNLENLKNVERRVLDKNCVNSSKSLVVKFKDKMAYNLVSGRAEFVDAMADSIEQALENRSERV